MAIYTVGTGGTYATINACATAVGTFVDGDEIHLQDGGEIVEPSSTLIYVGAPGSTLTIKADPSATTRPIVKLGNSDTIMAAQYRHVNYIGFDLYKDNSTVTFLREPGGE